MNSMELAHFTLGCEQTQDRCYVTNPVNHAKNTTPVPIEGTC